MRRIDLRQPQKYASLGLGLLIVGAACLSGCAGSSSSLNGAWQGSATRQSFNRVLIVGVSTNFTQRCAFEWSMASQIISAGSTQAFISCDSMTSKDPLTRANIELVVAKVHADAVLTSAIVSMQLGGQKGNSRDTRATPYYQVTGQGYVTGALGEFGVPVAFVQLETSPSIQMITGNVHVLTKLFNPSDAALLYTLDTDAKSNDVQSSSSGIETVTGLIAKRLRSDGVIH